MFSTDEMNWRRTAAYVAVGALAFQAVHLIEHAAQLGYWFLHPDRAPWLTPWAAEGRDALAVGGRTMLGGELLHLLGNLIFLAGLLGLSAILTERRFPGMRSLRFAVVIQGVHVLEHLSLTATTVLFGEAIGVTTAFGLVTGVGLTSLRVWAHFAINLVATWFAMRALAEMLSHGLISGRVGDSDGASSVTRNDHTALDVIP